MREDLSRGEKDGTRGRRSLCYCVDKLAHSPFTQPGLKLDIPLVSAVLPAYNAERFIAQTLASVQRQSYRNLEILVVDDGSTDRTAHIIAMAAELDGRIKLLTQDNRGAAAARNLGIQKARGEFIAPIDSDDLWYPDKIALQVERIRQSPASVGLIYAWSVKIDETGAIIDENLSVEFEGPVLWPLVLTCFLRTPSIPLIRRECLERVGDFRTDFRSENAQGCEDWDLYLRIAERYHFRVVPEYLICYRQATGTMSGNDESMARSYSLMMRDFRAKHPEISDRIYRWSRAQFFMYLDKCCRANGRYRAGTMWLVLSIWNDPALLLCKVVYTALLYNLIKLTVPWIAPNSSKGRKRLGAFRGRFRQQAGTGLTLSDLHKRRAQRLERSTIFQKIRLKDAFVQGVATSERRE